jgi:hypothetical protein
MDRKKDIVCLCPKSDTIWVFEWRRWQATFILQPLRLAPLACARFCWMEHGYKSNDPQEQANRQNFPTVGLFSSLYVKNV